MQLSFQEILSDIESMHLTLGLSPYHWITNEALPELVGRAHRLGNIEMVEKQENTYEEDANVYTIYHFKDHEVFIKFWGYYNSYSGLIDCTPIEVKPTTVTRVEFLPV